MHHIATPSVLLCLLLESDALVAGPSSVSGSYTVQIAADSAPPGALLTCKARLIPDLPGAESLRSEPATGFALVAGPGSLCIVRVPYAFAVAAPGARLLWELESAAPSAGPVRRTAQQLAVSLPPSGASATVRVHAAF